MASSVVCPCGSMNQRTRGAVSALGTSVSSRTASAPSLSSSCAFSKVRFQTTTRCPPRSSRRAMLAPMRPKPIMATSMLTPFLWSARRAAFWR